MIPKENVVVNIIRKRPDFYQKYVLNRLCTQVKYQPNL